MWQHRFETTTDLLPVHIWALLADVAKWPELDHNIDKIQITAEPAPGVPFTLKPKGGPRLKFRIGAFEPPAVYSDICQLLLAEMTTRHSLERDPNASQTGRKHASGLPAQTERILRAAHAASGRSVGA
jgi:hypothetical protein